MLPQALTTMLAKVVLFAGISLDPAQTACLADNIYHESRGESVTGQVAVAFVTINRSKSTGKTLCAIVHESSQFSWVGHANSTDTESQSYAQAVEIAALAQIGFINNPIGMATHYHSGDRPYWATDAHYVGRIDNHHFYEGVDGRYSQISENSTRAGNDTDATQRGG